MNNLIVWCIYHNDSQVYEYNLDNVPNYIRLFNVNDLNMTDDNINYLNPYLCELVAFYYVWKNQIKSDYVGFCHYRRFFKKISINNLNNYGVHYFGLIKPVLKNMMHENVYNNEHHELLYEYLTSLNIFDNKILDEYFHKDIVFNLPLKLSFIMKWDMFNKFCQITFGFLEYMLTNYKNPNEYEGLGRKYAWEFEIICGIILSLLTNNIELYETNWSIQYNKVLLTKSDDKDKIILWAHKNNRTNAFLYVISNLDNIYNEENLFIIPDESSLPQDKTVIKLDINQYISCKESEDFNMNNYIIKNI